MLFLVLLATVTAALHPKCRIAQRGNDGFGHQYQGKLSCIMLAAMDNRFLYMHRPFHTFEHITARGEYAEWYTNVSFGHPLAIGDQETLDDAHWPAMLQSPERLCKPETIYVTDNCWPAMNWLPTYATQVRWYQPVVRDPFFGSAARAKYAYVPARFPNRSVVAIHVRRGDAMWRIEGHEQHDGLPFFLKAMQHSVDFIRSRNAPPAMFVIATDEPKWSGIAAMLQRYPDQAVLLPDDVFESFEYFVHAYGLIVSMSSLSYAGWLLNEGVQFALIPKHLQERENVQWLKPEHGWFTGL
jgi:hypothetical protein